MPEVIGRSIGNIVKTFPQVCSFPYLGNLLDDPEFGSKMSKNTILALSPMFNKIVILAPDGLFGPD